MKVLVISGKPDFERFLRGSSHYSDWCVVTRSLYHGSYAGTIRFYGEYRPDLVVIDNCEGPATGRHVAIRKLEREMGIPPVTIQLINDYDFMRATKPGPRQQGQAGYRPSGLFDPMRSF